jgi:hypothetical protein
MGYYFTGGLGDVTPSQIGGSAQGAAVAGQDFAAGASGGGGSNYVKGTGAALLAAAPFTPPPAGVIMAVAGAALEFLGAMGVGSGCGQKCVLSTTYANKAEALFRQNCNAYFSYPAPRTVTQQQEALTVFDAIWTDLEQQCGVASLGDPGKRCITDRQAGACTWKQTGDSPWPGGPAKGECWNWFNAYRDPIANDPVVADTVTSSVSGAAASLESLLGGSSGSSSMVSLLLVAGLVALAVLS